MLNIFRAHRLLYPSTLDLRVMKKKKRGSSIEEIVKHPPPEAPPEPGIRAIAEPGIGAVRSRGRGVGAVWRGLLLVCGQVPEPAWRLEVRVTDY